RRNGRAVRHDAIHKADPGEVAWAGRVRKRRIDRRHRADLAHLGRTRRGAPSVVHHGVEIVGADHPLIIEPGEVLWSVGDSGCRDRHPGIAISTLVLVLKSYGVSELVNDRLEVRSGALHVLNAALSPRERRAAVEAEYVSKQDVVLLVSPRHESDGGARFPRLPRLGYYDGQLTGRLHAD